MTGGGTLSRRLGTFGVLIAVAVSLCVATVAQNASASEPTRRDAPPVVTTPIWIDDTRAFEIVAQDTDSIDLLVLDRSGHAVDPADFPQAVPIPRLAERVTPVRIWFDPSNSTGAPRPLLITGFYRFESSVVGCDGAHAGAVLVCVGFSQADPGSILDPTQVRVAFADMPNMAVEVSAVLDVLQARPDVFPRFTRRVVFAGYSLGAMVGHLMVHPAVRDDRIRAIAARAGFAPDWIPALTDADTWADAPRLLMVNVHRDAVAPYDAARRTYEAASQRGRVTFLTGNSTDHTVLCGALIGFETAWVDARLGLPSDLRAARERVEAARCARFGVRDGGSIGDGRFDFLRP